MTLSAPPGQVKPLSSKSLVSAQSDLLGGVLKCAINVAGGGPLHVSSPTPRSTGVLPKQLVSCSTVGALGERDLTPKRTPSKKVVKRFKKHEMDAGAILMPLTVSAIFCI